MRRLEVTAYAITATAFIAHFALTIAYVMPLTPAKLQYEPVVTPLVNAYAPQTWTLFAPEPVNSNQSLLVKCLTAEQFRATLESKDAGIDGWHDITRPLIEAHQHNRLGPYDRLLRAQSTSLREWAGGVPELATWHKACQNGSHDACKFEHDALVELTQRASTVLTAVASSYCEEVGTQSAGVALRIRVTPTRKWSERFSTSPLEPNDYDLGVYKAVPSIAPTGFYLANN